jgi:hypothetical protein
MALFRKQEQPKRTSSLSSIPILRAITSRRRSKVYECDHESPPSYSDATLQQQLIGQQPMPRRSSKVTLLIWQWQQEHTFGKQRSTSDLGLPSGRSTALKPSPTAQKEGTARLPLPKAFIVKPVQQPTALRNQTSMSFPHHLRCKSQPMTATLLQHSLAFPSMDAIVTGNHHPWWETRNSILGEKSSSQSTDENGQSSPGVTAVCVQAKDDAMDTEGHINKDTMAIEEEGSTASDNSFNTCPTPPLDADTSDSSSSFPSACTPREAHLDICIKDPCQSPLPDSFAFSGNMEESTVELSQVIEDWGDQPEGLAIDNFEDGVQKFITSEGQGRQDKLKEQKSNEYISKSTSTMLKPTLKNRLSLSDFLHELRDGSKETQIFAGDDSFSSSFLDDEEEDSVQICQAWRGKVASFARLGASLVNEPLYNMSNDSDHRLTYHEGSTSAPPLRQKASRISLRPVDLDPIQEASFDLCEMSASDSLTDFDLCAHLLKRAKAAR